MQTARGSLTRTVRGSLMQTARGSLTRTVRGSLMQTVRGSLTRTVRALCDSNCARLSDANRAGAS